MSLPPSRFEFVAAALPPQALTADRNTLFIFLALWQLADGRLGDNISSYLLGR